MVLTVMLDDDDDDDVRWMLLVLITVAMRDDDEDGLCFVKPCAAQQVPKVTPMRRVMSDEDVDGIEDDDHDDVDEICHVAPRS